MPSSLLSICFLFFFNFVFSLLLNMKYLSYYCNFIFNMSGIAPYKFGLYLFYGITLCLPSFMFVTGLSLFLARIFHLRFLVITILVMLWGLSVAWLPYHWHGTFDFLVVGGGRGDCEIIAFISVPLRINSV